MITKYKKLKNGVHLVSASNLNARSVSMGIAFLSGSNDEKLGSYGVAHMLEHIVFKGTKSFPTEQEIKEYLDEFGGLLNACTSRSHTAFTVKILRNGTEKAWDLLASLVTEPLIDSQKVKEEQKIIVHEIGLLNSGQNYQIYRLLLKGIFGRKHTLSREISGTKKDVSSLTPEKIHGYMQDYYNRDNVSVFFTGAISEERAEELAINFGEKLPHGKKVKRNIVPPIKKNFKRKISKRIDTTREKIMIGIPIMARDNKDIYIFDLAAAMIGSGSSSPLLKILRREKQLVYNASCSIIKSLTQSIFIIQTNAKIGQSEKVIKEILKLLKDCPKDKKRFKNAKSILLNRLFLHCEDTFNFLYFLINRFPVKKSFIFSEYRKEINQISYKRFIRVYNQYIKPERITVATILSKK